MHLRHVVVAALISGTHAFHLLPIQKVNSFVTYIEAKSKPKTPEYIVEDGDVMEVPRRAPKSDGKASEIRLTSPPNPLQEYVQANSVSTKSQKEKPNLQYAALPPGTVVQIQVGDIGLARKAWKKRRRSGSPLLVPCSVLNVDRASTVRWNLIYLLEKFGRSAGSKGGVRASLANLSQRYRSHLKTSLAKQATSLGFESPKSLVQALFNERVQKSYGIDMIEDENGDLCLQAPLSRLRAQKRANRSPVLQVEDDSVEDTLRHTGVVRTRREEENIDEKDNLYNLQPLSAALRVSQKEDVDGGNIQTGSLHTAVVFEFDAAGDAGAPLITLSLNSAPRERLKFGSDGNNRDTIRRPKYMLNDLKIGDGPIKGKVVRFIKGGALIDCGIGRPAGQRPESDLVRVLGLLKFNEAVIEGAGSATQIGWSDDTSLVDEDDDEEEEDWKDIFSFEDLELSEEDLVNEDEDGDDEVSLAELEKDPDLVTLFNFDDGEVGEEVEDITHMFTTEADGSLTYTDPDTGEVQHITADFLDDEYDLEHDDDDDGDDDEGEEDYDDDDDDDLIDVFGTLDSKDNDDDEDDGPVLLNQSTPTPLPTLSERKVRSKRLHLNDEVEVYVRSVAKQSNQVFLTMRASIKGKKAKDIKQESGKEKKLTRLLKQVGGMGRIRELHGREMDGIVKATSHTGDWLYVEPLEGDLPVGIAYGEKASLDGVNKGDTIRIQLDGIDEARGQLSMKVLNKLSP